MEEVLYTESAVHVCVSTGVNSLAIIQKSMWAQAESHVRITLKQHTHLVNTIIPQLLTAT